MQPASHLWRGGGLSSWIRPDQRSVYPAVFLTLLDSPPACNLISSWPCTAQYALTSFRGSNNQSVWGRPVQSPGAERDANYLRTVTRFLGLVLPKDLLLCSRTEPFADHLHGCHMMPYLFKLDLAIGPLCWCQFHRVAWLLYRSSTPFDKALACKCFIACNLTYTQMQSAI